MQRVHPTLALQQVVAGAAIHLVIATPAIQRIVTAASLEHIGPAASADVVVVTRPDQRILAATAEDRVTREAGPGGTRSGRTGFACSTGERQVELIGLNQVGGTGHADVVFAGRRQYLPSDRLALTDPSRIRHGQHRSAIGVEKFQREISLIGGIER